MHEHLQLLPRGKLHRPTNTWGFLVAEVAPSRFSVHWLQVYSEHWTHRNAMERLVHFRRKGLTGYSRTNDKTHYNYQLACSALEIPPFFFLSSPG